MAYRIVPNRTLTFTVFCRLFFPERLGSSPHMLRHNVRESYREILIHLLEWRQRHVPWITFLPGLYSRARNFGGTVPPELSLQVYRNALNVVRRCSATVAN